MRQTTRCKSIVGSCSKDDRASALTGRDCGCWWRACATEQEKGQMFETLFGTETPLALRFSFAFLIMLGLIGTAAWAVRRFATARLRSDSSRGRAPRLAVIDIANVDERRRLILVRRDSVEHLLMIGGPIDIVVEANIVRTVAAPREVAVTRLPAAAEPRPHTIPDLDKRSLPQQPEAAAAPREVAVIRLPAAAKPPPHTIPGLDERSLPQQPEAAATPRPALRTEALPQAPADWKPGSHAELFARAQHGALAVLADDLVNRRVDGGGLPGNDRPPLSRPHMPIELASADSAPVNPNLAKLAHHLEALLRTPDMPAERREGYAPAMPAGAPSQTAENAAAAIPQIRARAARLTEPKSLHTEAKPSQKAPLHDSDSLELAMANLLSRRIS